jgi:hypothetical protein
MNVDSWVVHPPHVRFEAHALFAQGMGDRDIAKMLRVPLRTVRDWRRCPNGRGRARRTCPRCWRPSKRISFEGEDYTELLGLYLGDGSLSSHTRTARLRIHLDASYPQIVEDTRVLLERCFPENCVGMIHEEGGAMVSVSLYSTHLCCLLPQHGEGKKHERDLRLESWQRVLVEETPWGLLRGLIRTDGCVFTNRTGRYRYLTYDFSNKSEDIIRLFTMAAGLVGVQHRTTCWRGLWRVRINKRASVQRMLAHIGTKV